MSAGTGQQPLLDLGRLVVGIRRMRRVWLSLALLGLVGGGALAVLMPPPPSAITRILVVHEQDQPSDTGSLIRTDAALAATTRIAAAALDELGSSQRPEEFIKEYTVTGLTNNVLEISVEAPTEDEAVRKAGALAAAFIADHVGRVRAAATAEAKTLIEQRDRIQGELDTVNRDITAAEAAALAAGDQQGTEGAEQQAETDAAALDSLYARRAELTSRVTDLGQQAEQAAIGAPRVSAGTQVVDAPRPVPVSLIVNGATNSALGMVLGLAAGLALAVVTGVVRDRPVLRRDISAHLGASVIAQVRTPRRGPLRRPGSRAARERTRVAATLVRLVRDAAGQVSVLELGSPRTAAALVTEAAAGLAGDRDVAIVADPADRVAPPDLAGRGGRAIRVVGAEDTSPARAGETRIGIGSVTPGTAWTDLSHLGTETVLVVRAGSASTDWLHTVARQLSDSRIPVIGVVLVNPDPRDRTDGTLWDGLHTALRGRTETLGHRGVNGSNGNGANGFRVNGAELPTKRLPPVQPHLRKLAERAVHDLPTKRFGPVRPEDVNRRTKG